MEDRIRLSYFYGKEADQFSFYKIPKLLFTEEYFKKISVEAKVLYGLMLDRMSLSMKNQWMDDEGRAYIYYSLEDIMEALGCSNKKAISIMKELDTDAGIGLIKKKRQGQGKPTMIYLKQFMVQDVQKCRNFTSEQKSTVSEVKNLHVLKCKNKTVVVASNEYPAELVRSKFLKLTSSHIEYAMGCMKSNTTKVHNIKKYLLATLFNAPSTISGYYQAEVNHDYPQFAVSGK